jgi:hypothetical protein
MKPKNKSVANRDNVINTTVVLSPEQALMFKRAAEANTCTIGELILSLACLQLNLTPNASMEEYLPGPLWEYSTGRFTPYIAPVWREVGFEVKEEAAA